MASTRRTAGPHRLGKLGSGFIFLAALCVRVAPAQEVAPGQEGVAFKWAFGVLVGGPDTGKLEAITRDRVLRTGDQFRMMVELVRPCFVYVVHHSAEDDLNLLFPYDLRQFDTDYATARRYYIPKGSSWFELDSHVGDETFYLLASPERLKDLERLLTQYQSAGSASTGDLKRQILENLRALRKQRRELAAPAERPATIGGTIRGHGKPGGAGRPDVATIADEISSGGLVVRTFTLEHK